MLRFDVVTSSILDVLNPYRGGLNSYRAVFEYKAMQHSLVSLRPEFRAGPTQISFRISPILAPKSRESFAEILVSPGFRWP